MAGIDNLKRRILKDDEITAELVIKDAQDKANEILIQSKKKAESTLKEAETRANKESDNRKDRIIARAKLDARNNILAAKQEAIDRILSLADERISRMDKEEYTFFVEELLISNIETGCEEVIFSDNDKGRIDPEVIARVNEKLVALNKNGMLRISNEKRNIKSGFLLKNGNIEINCSIDSQIKVLRESLEGKIASLLFEDR